MQVQTTQAIRRHQHHADAGSRLRAAGHLHHHDDGDGAGHQGQPAEGAAAPSLAKPKTKAITIANDGKIFLDTIPVTLPELETAAGAAEGADAGISQSSERRRPGAVPEGDGRARPAGPHRPQRRSGSPPSHW